MSNNSRSKNSYEYKKIPNSNQKSLDDNSDMET